MLEIINPANGEKIQIADSDLVNHLNWQMAVNECKNLGNGWRLPTIDEIKLIPYNEMAKNDSLKVLHNSYWTSSETEKNDFNVSPNALKYNFGRGMQFNASKDQLHLVRPIRTIQIVNQNNTSISNPTQNLNTVKAKSKNETKSPMKNAIDGIPTTNFLEDLITGENLTNTRSFLLYLSSCIILFFGGRYIFETTNIKGDGNDLLAIIIHLILIIISIIMMLASPILLIVSLNYSSSISELFYYNRNKRIVQEEAIRQAKHKKEQAIQNELYRKEQAKYEEEERKRIQRESEIWNSKSPNERAKIKFKEVEDAIHNLNGNYADGIFREWEAEFEKYVIKNDIISAKDKIFQLKLLDTQQRQRQSEIREAREHQKERDYQNERIRREQEKNNKKWYCPKCTSVVPGRDRPSDRNCPGGKYHEWQLRS
jgi:hypothetical protein